MSATNPTDVPSIRPPRPAWVGLTFALPIGIGALCGMVLLTAGGPPFFLVGLVFGGLAGAVVGSAAYAGGTVALRVLGDCDTGATARMFFSLCVTAAVALVVTAAGVAARAAPDPVEGPAAAIGAAVILALTGLLSALAAPLRARG